jgi:hypothetical protein
MCTNQDCHKTVLFIWLQLLQNVQCYIPKVTYVQWIFLSTYHNQPSSYKNVHLMCKSQKMILLSLIIQLTASYKQTMQDIWYSNVINIKVGSYEMRHLRYLVSQEPCVSDFCVNLRWTQQVTLIQWPQSIKPYDILPQETASSSSTGSTSPCGTWCPLQVTWQ